MGEVERVENSSSVLPLNIDRNQLAASVDDHVFSSHSLPFFTLSHESTHAVALASGALDGLSTGVLAFARSLVSVVSRSLLRRRGCQAFWLAASASAGSSPSIM